MTKQVHFIAEGRVFCRGVGRDIDFERCLVCPLLADIDLDSRHPKVTCQLPVEVEDRLLAGEGLAIDRPQMRRDLLGD